MVDFNKMLTQCRKHTDPEFLQDMKFCKLVKNHNGECKFD